MIVFVVVGVIIPAATILSAVAWGWKNDTLAESTQDRYDLDFERIVEHL